MSALLASLEKFGEVFINWGSCRHSLQSEWPLASAQNSGRPCRHSKRFKLQQSLVSKCVNVYKQNGLWSFFNSGLPSSDYDI